MPSVVLSQIRLIWLIIFFKCAVPNGSLYSHCTPKQGIIHLVIDFINLSSHMKLASHAAIHKPRAIFTIGVLNSMRIDPEKNVSTVPGATYLMTIFL